MDNERVYLATDPVRAEGIVVDVRDDGTVVVWWERAHRRWVYDPSQLRAVCSCGPGDCGHNLVSA